MRATGMNPARWSSRDAANQDAIEQSGVFVRPLPVPRAALLVLRAGVLCLLLGRIGWLLLPVMPSGAGSVPADLGAALPAGSDAALGYQLLSCLLVAFYATCAYLVASTELQVRTGWQPWLHDRSLMIASAVLLGTGLVGGDPALSAHWLERLATALLPLVWVLTRRSGYLHFQALALARAGVVLGFVAHGLLFLAWRTELPLLGHLLVADLELGAALTHAVMLGLFVLYAGLGSLIAAGAWLRGLDRVLLGAAVTLGAFTAGIRICLGLEPGFFQATAAHWLLSTLLGSAVGCLPLFMALCVDQRLVALGGGLASSLVSAPGSARRPGPRSAA
jgi:hypothetical protein